MGLHQQRRMQKAGLPEFVFVCLAAVAVLFLALSWRSNNTPTWLNVEGVVVECNVDRSQYHVVDTPYNVRLTYEYVVGNTKYTGGWSGNWPMNNSPNALPPQRIFELERPGHPLQIACNPADYSLNRLHGQPEKRGVAYTVMAILGCIALFLYSAKIYPQWKTHQTVRFART